MSGKGDKNRVKDKKQYRSNYDLIFGAKKYDRKSDRKKDNKSNQQRKGG